MMKCDHCCVTSVQCIVREKLSLLAMSKCLNTESEIMLPDTARHVVSQMNSDPVMVNVNRHEPSSQHLRTSLSLPGGHDGLSGVSEQPRPQDDGQHRVAQLCCSQVGS